MVYHKIRLIIGCILIALIVSVNTFTVTVFLVNVFKGDTVGNTSETYDADVPAFTAPSEMIVSGRGGSISIYPTDELFETLLILNERRYTYVPSLESQDEFDMTKSDAYCIEYVYDSPVKITLRGYKTANVTKLTFVLTGRHEGKVAFKDGEVSVTLGLLSVEPELNITVVEMLSKSPATDE